MRAQPVGALLTGVTMREPKPTQTQKNTNPSKFPTTREKGSRGREDWGTSAYLCDAGPITAPLPTLGIICNSASWPCHSSVVMMVVAVVTVRVMVIMEVVTVINDRVWTSLKLALHPLSPVIPTTTP